MSHAVTCPKCKVSIGHIPDGGRLQAICATCHFEYVALEGKVARRNSRQVTTQRATTKQMGSYSRDYDMELDLANGEREYVGFSISGRDDRIAIRKGDRAAFIWTVKNGRKQELVSACNTTTGEYFSIATPGAQASLAATGVAFIVLVLVCFGLWGLTGLGFVWSISLAIAAAVATQIAVSNRWAPRAEVGVAAAHQLSLSAELLRRRAASEKTHRKHATEFLRWHDLGEKIDGVVEKMESVDAAAYADRLAVMRRARRALQEQTKMEKKVLDACDKLIKMIEIEMESASIASAPLPDVQAMTDRLTALQTLEQAADETRLQLQADDEVRRLLST